MFRLACLITSNSAKKVQFSQGLGDQSGDFVAYRSDIKHDPSYLLGTEIKTGLTESGQAVGNSGFETNVGACTESVYMSP